MNASPSARVAAILNQMPYGAAVPSSAYNFIAANDELDADTLCDWLEAYRQVIQDVAAREAATRQELDTLKDERQAVRTFLGLQS